MTKQPTDYIDGLFDEAATEPTFPKNSDGSLRVAAFTEPAKTSAELEARERYHFANPIWPEFVNADGTPEVLPLTAAEREHFTAEELEQLDALAAKRN